MNNGRFRYYLKDATGNYLYVAGGSVLGSSTAMPLTNAPIDWGKTKVVWERHRTYHGVFRSAMPAVAFVTDAATILRSIYYTQGVEGKCVFLIQIKNEDDENYADFYTGNIDFSEATDERLQFNCSVQESGLTAQIRAKDKTPQEIPILNSDSVPVYHDGINLKGNAHYVVAQQGIAAPIAMSNTFIIAPSGTEGINGAIVTNSTYQTIPAVLTLAGGQPIYETTVPEQNILRIKMNCWVSWPSAASNPATFRIGMLYGNPGGTVTRIWLWSAANALSPGSSATYNVDTYPFSGGANFSLLAGGQVMLIVAFEQGGSSVNSTLARFRVLDDTGTVDIGSIFRRAPTVVKGYRGIQLFQKLIDAMAPGYTAASSYLSNASLSNVDHKPYNVIYTGGNALRGLGDGNSVTTAAKITTTLEDFRNDLFCRDMAGIGIEGNTVRLEPLSYFYNNNTLTKKLGLVKDLSITPANDFLFNLFKLGYTYQEYDKLNGKDDTLLTETYGTDKLRNKKDADWVSPYIASFIVQEYMRTDVGSKVTTDAKSDNDVFLIEVGDTISAIFLPPPFVGVVNLGYPLRRSHVLTGNSLTNVFAGTSAYNIELSIDRNARRLGALISTAMSLIQNATLNFKTADQNAEMMSRLSAAIGQTIAKADLNISQLASPLLLPFIARFTTPVDPDTQSLIATNPYGRVEVDWRNPRTGELVTVKGFMDSIAIQPGDNEAQQWSLLLCPDMDLTQLI